MILNVMVEPSYRGTYWCEQYMRGIRSEAEKRNLTIHEILHDPISSPEWDPDNRRKICLLIGTSISWVPDRILRLSQADIHAILAAYSNNLENWMRVSFVTADYRKAMQDLVSYLMLCGRDPIALFGVNPDSSSDRLKKNAFLSLSYANYPRGEEEDIFMNTGSLKRTCRDFYQKANRYHSAICVNDISAILLIRFLSAKGIQVPEDMYIVSFGDTILGQIQDPGITTAVLNFVEVGKQAVEIFLLLNKNPQLSAVSTSVHCEIKIRQSTDFKHASGTLSMGYNSPPPKPVPFYEDPDVTEIFRLEGILSHCDELDRKILAGLIQNVRYGDLSERLYISENALKYRVKKILSLSGGMDRDSLTALAGKYLTGGNGGNGR